jgi:hypothetical protein
MADNNDNSSITSVQSPRRYTDDELNQIWEKASVIDNFDSTIYRKDACGAWIMRDKYGTNSPFGWEVDHIYPEKKLRQHEVPEDMINNIINLRPLNYFNNRSKGTDFPSYQASITSVDRKNVTGSFEQTISSELVQQVLEYYREFLNE